MEDEQEPTEKDLAELAALADGSIAPDRRDVVEARVAGSQHLRERLERQRRAIAVVRAAAMPAPEALRRRVEELPRRRPTTRRFAWTAAAVAGTALIAAVLMVALPARAPQVSGLADAAVVGTREPKGPAPGRYDGSETMLAGKVEGLRFPNWGRFGWRASGRRTDTVAGRRAVTVFYVSGGRRLAYTIVSGPGLPVPDGVRSALRDGTRLESLDLGGRLVVTWRRRGRTCVLSGGGVGREELLRLASWRGGGALRY